ncbi:MAG: PIN domain-containing protein [Planctomycetota bacterium]
MRRALLRSARVDQQDDHSVYARALARGATLRARVVLPREAKPRVALERQDASGGSWRFVPEHFGDLALRPNPETGEARTVLEALAPGRYRIRARPVVASDLTLVECERALHRSVATGTLPEVAAVEARALLTVESVHWDRLAMGDEVIERARRPFPHEPIRTLDALHLASALLARSAFPDLAVLTLDRRVRSNARALGFEVFPAALD